MTGLLYRILRAGFQHLIWGGELFTFNPIHTAAEKRLRIRNTLEMMIHEMYASLEAGGFTGIPQVQ